MRKRKIICALGQMWSEQDMTITSNITQDLIVGLLALLVS